MSLPDLSQHGVGTTSQHVPERDTGQARPRAQLGFQFEIERLLFGLACNVLIKVEDVADDVELLLQLLVSNDQCVCDQVTCERQTTCKRNDLPKRRQSPRYMAPVKTETKTAFYV